MTLLSPPGSRPAFLSALPPDSRFGPAGSVRVLRGYDMGLPPPKAPPGAVGADLQQMTAAAATTELLDRVSGFFASHNKRFRLTASRLLRWLDSFPGDTWEQRWIASGADAAPHGFRREVFGGSANLGAAAVNAVILAGLIRPSYGWLLESRGGAHLPRKVLTYRSPEAAVQLRALPEYVRASHRDQTHAERCLARVMTRSGRLLDELGAEDLLTYADVVRTTGQPRREHLAWELLVSLGPLAAEPSTLRSAWSAKGNTRQHSTATLVDRYGIPPSGVRDLLVDYLNEIRPSMDYSSLEGLAYRLARLFWWQVLQINPDQQGLSLGPATAVAWREQLAVTTDGRPRREVHSILFAVRALYRDLAEWSHEEPARWGIWVAPCPVPKAESHQASKAKRNQKSRMQARTRVLTPLLPALLAEAERRKAWSTRLLEAAVAVADGEEFTVGRARFRRSARPPVTPEQTQACVWAELLEADPAGPAPQIWNGRVNVSRNEEDDFWAWAMVQTLRHTGIRLEEMLELTQLSLRHYTSTTTGTVVPLLHIVPSKNDIERLIPMSPELVSVLLAVLRRAKAGEHQVPLSVRYDPNEKLHGQPFPHLFARRVGSRQEVISHQVVRRMLGQLAFSANLTDAGQPVHFTPHDFRRLFTTEMIGGGLPLHIAATLLGHLSLETTRGYTAVFPEEVIAAHRHFLERRRQKRPLGELRDATDAEWAEFEDHFLLRKVALGDCHRPYGTPCIHEHACIKCRFLAVDPAQLARIEEMTGNAEARLEEAKGKVWLGEVAAIEESLGHLRLRRDEMLAKRQHGTDHPAAR